MSELMCELKILIKYVSVIVKHLFNQIW